MISENKTLNKCTPKVFQPSQEVPQTFFISRFLGTQKDKGRVRLSDGKLLEGRLLLVRSRFFRFASAEMLRDKVVADHELAA